MRLIAPMVPHVAEEAWAAAGHEGLVADAAWPVVDPAVLVEDEVTIAIQINGKLRDTLTLPKGTERADIDAAALPRAKLPPALDNQPTPTANDVAARTSTPVHHEQASGRERTK